MRIDFYTKAVLTLIASSLVYLCLAPKVTTAHADGPTPVMIVGVAGDGVLPVGLAGTVYVEDHVPGLPRNGHWVYQAIPVKVISQSPASATQGTQK